MAMGPDPTDFMRDSAALGVIAVASYVVGCSYINLVTDARKPDLRSGPQCRYKPDVRSGPRWSLDEGIWLQVSQKPVQLQKKQRVGTADVLTTALTPFVRFKRTVDGAFSPIANWRARRQYVAEAKTRWYGHEISRTPLWRRRKEEGVSRHAAVGLIRLAELRTIDVDPILVDRLYTDEGGRSDRADGMADAMLAFGGASYFSPDVGDRLPSTALLRHSPPSYQPRWLSIAWFKDSKYSPIQLEAIEGLPQHNWRAAFEDLMFTSLNRSPPLTTVQQSPFPPQESGLAWTINLLAGGFLPHILPSWRRLSEGRVSTALPHGVTKKLPRVPSARHKRMRHEFKSLVAEIQASGRSSVILQQLQILTLPWLGKAEYQVHQRVFRAAESSNEYYLSVSSTPAPVLSSSIQDDLETKSMLIHRPT